MTRTLLIKGSEAGDSIFLYLDGKPTEFSLDKNIEAQSIFDLLDYSVESIYRIERGEPLGIKPDSFASFCELIEDITTKINELNTKYEQVSS